MSDLTREEAEAMLVRLTAHYKEPVMPIGRYCLALKMWQGALRDVAKSDSLGTLSKSVDHAFLAIRKSNLLFRTLYLGQAMRTTKCPKHDGRWSGCTAEPCPHGCSVGMNVTGWLP